MLKSPNTLLVMLFMFLQIVSYSQRPSLRCKGADAGDDRYICPGGSAVIGTPGQPGYTYYWTPSTGLSNSNSPEPTASPSSTTTYTVLAVYNLLQNGDFEAGFTGFNTDYGMFPNGDGLCSTPGIWGSVAVSSNPSQYFAPWCVAANHTPNGNMALNVDGSCGTNRRVWYQTVTVTPNTNYYFYGWASALSQNSGNASVTPLLRVSVTGTNTTNIIQNFSVPGTTSNPCNQWHALSGTWNSGSSTTALIEIYDDNSTQQDNDFNLDDLIFTPCPITNSSTDNVTVNVGNYSSAMISPTGPIEECVHYEASQWLTLTTNLTSNIQWFDNGVPISGETNQSYVVNNNPSDCSNWPTCTGNITVKNTLDGCISNSVQIIRKNWSVPCYSLGNSPYQTPINYCKNQPGVIRQFPGLTSSNPPTYWWEVQDPFGNPATGVTIFPMYTTNNAATISFANYPYSTARIIPRAVENGCDNYWIPASTGVNYYTVSVDQNCRVASPLTNVVQLFPNPATNQVSVQANDVITKIEISSTTLPIFKIIGSNGTNLVKINTSTFKPGVYGCKVTTKKGVVSVKFVIEK